MGKDQPGTSAPVSETYDRTYFEEGCGRPYQRDDYWLGWFSRIADRIVAEIGPKSVLDAGCAMGMLVEALRDRGVEAFGLDVSDYALEQVRSDIKPYCRKASILEPFPRRYDLILCVEVLEHLEPADAIAAAANLCRHSDDLVFSSTSDDFKEATHVNVRPPEYWAELFAQQGFFRDTDYDASYVAPWAIRLRKARDPMPRQIGNYERLLARLRLESGSLRDLAAEHRAKIATQDAEIDRLRRIEFAYRAIVEGLSYRVATRLGRTASRTFPRESRRGRFLRWAVSRMAGRRPAAAASSQNGPPPAAG